MQNQNNLLYKKVKMGILGEISEMKVHDRLPSRNALYKKYNVTRTTVERAISELIGEGYLYARDGSGTYVKEFSVMENEATCKHIPSWGIILPNIMHDNYPGILRGVADVASECGINAIICNSDNFAEKQTEFIYKLIDSAVEGIVIVPAIIGKENIEPFKKLKDMAIPFVFCNRDVSGIDAARVASNNFYGAYQATRHLISKGYKRIGYISRPMYSTVFERYQGYVSALMEAGMEPDDKYIEYDKTYDREGAGFISTRRLLDRNPVPDALFCFNDNIAEGAFAAIKEKGMEVGKDIAVIGYDNTSLCDSLAVKLSSVQLNTYEIGVKAATLLQSIIKGESMMEKKLVLVQPELIIRKSSG